VQLQEVAHRTWGEQLPVGPQVVHRGEQAVTVDDHTDQAVVEHDRVAGRRGGRPRGHLGRRGAQGRHAGARVRGGVERQAFRTVTGE
jgi:hypothetical protein